VDLAADNPDTETPASGFRSSTETLQTTVKKVYSAESEGAHYRAYVVDWQDTEVVAIDTLGNTDLKTGDAITIMVQRVEMPLGERTIRLLQFLAIDFSAFEVGGGMNQEASGEE
jgi:hypothetical protein